MKTYALTDVVRLELRERRNDRWSFYSVTAIRNDGTSYEQPQVASVEQAEKRTREWFPNATVVLIIEEVD